MSTTPNGWAWTRSCVTSSAAGPRIAAVRHALRARGLLADCDQPDVVFYHSLDQMVRKAKLDGLLVGTRCDLHTPYAIEVSRYDLPLYLEKPVAVSMEQATALESAFENARCQVVVSFPLEVSGHCRKARTLIESGAVGRPDHVDAVNYVPYGTTYWERGYRDYAVTQGLFLSKMYSLLNPQIRP